jgi:L-ascorbate metabolism protein UlaG (beta-lactamase superfamily)
MVFEFNNVKIKWLGHSAFQIKKEVTIYIDPFEIEETEPADLILVTHDHYDHCSPDDIVKIQTDDTIIVAPAVAAKKLAGNTKIIKEGQTLKLKNVLIHAVPAYNINKKFHPKEAGHVGYVITINGIKIYHAGDTDLIPEMEVIAADIALLPVSGTYVMTAHEAAEATKKIQPKIAIPMHYGSIVGSEKDANEFRDKAHAEVKILKKNE